MRILQILPELKVGGVETGTVDLAKYFVGHGHYSVVVSNGGGMVGDLEAQGTKHYQLPVHKKSIWTAFRCVKALKEIIEKENIDIVHARSRVPAWIAFFACRKTKATFVTTCHGYYSQNLFGRVMGWGKLVIVPSEVIGRHMIDHFHVPSENIRYIPRSVDLEKFNVIRNDAPGKSNYVISMVGRITPLKGHTYFLKAMAQVVRSMPHVRIWIIGDVPAKKEGYRHELEGLVERLGLKDHVEFLGNRKDIPQLLAQTDVLVLSTVTQEAFGRVILEAQAAGVPVVATKVGGVVEIIDDEKTGLLVLPKEPEAMAQAVLRLLRDRTLVNQFVTAAKEKLHAQFTLDHMAGKTLSVYQELMDSINILVIKLSSLGDIVLITASLRILRERYPKAKIYCLVGKEGRRILQRCPYIDGLIIFDHKEKDSSLPAIFDFAKKLRTYSFDMVIDFQNNRYSQLLSFLSFPKKSFGYKRRPFGFLLSNPVIAPNHDLPPVEHQFQILKMLGIEYSPACMLELWPTEADERYVLDLLDGEWLGNNTNIVGVNMAASAKWETKNWPLEHLAKLCDLLAAQNIRVVVTGMEKDREDARKLLSLTKSKPADLVGKTNILQLAALIRKCKVYITPDSAPMHLAAAMNTPFIAFFGPTSSRRHLPPARSVRVIEKTLPCAPCYSSECKIKTHDCMKNITPAEVAKHIEELMNGIPSKKKS